MQARNGDEQVHEKSKHLKAIVRKKKDQQTQLNIKRYRSQSDQVKYYPINQKKE